MHVIVTGAAGLIGSNIVSALNRQGQHDILAVDHLNHVEKRRTISHLSYAAYLDKEEFRARFLASSIAPPHVVFHMGACSSTTETNAAYLDDNNFLYTRQLCEWCLRHKARFIYASSAATYGNGAHGYADDHTLLPVLEPLNLYGRSKQKFDLWARKTGLLNQIVGLKYFNVYGPGEDHKGDMRSVINKAYRKIDRTGEMALFKSHRPGIADGMQTRDFVYVKDAVAVTLFFGNAGAASGIFNCGTGTPRTWLDLAHALFQAMGRSPRIRFVDMPIELRENYQYHTQADISKLRRAGYTRRFTSIEDGVSDYVLNDLSPRATAHNDGVTR